jgi:hypothetical protein
MEDNIEMGLKKKYWVCGMDPPGSDQGSDKTLNGWVKQKQNGCELDSSGSE